ncbi:MAG: hypothetical protein ACOX6S_14355 [Clostridia bacterium]
MGFFYEREENKKEIKIVYKHYPIFTGVVYLGCLVILLGIFNGASWRQPAAFVLLAVVLLQGIVYSGANGEIRRAQNENRNGEVHREKALLLQSLYRHHQEGKKTEGRNGTR